MSTLKSIFLDYGISNLGVVLRIACIVVAALISIKAWKTLDKKSCSHSGITLASIYAYMYILLTACWVYNGMPEAVGSTTDLLWSGVELTGLSCIYILTKRLNICSCLRAELGISAPMPMSK